MLAFKGIIPPDSWQHDPKLCDNMGYTVAYYLIKNNIKVPE